jgi:hypothetical protein
VQPRHGGSKADHDRTGGALGRPVKHCFDIVPRGVEQKRRVIPWVIRAFGGRSVVPASGSQASPMELLDRFAALGLKGEVRTARGHATGRPRVRCRNEELVGPKVVAGLASNRYPEDLQDRAIKMLGFVELSDDEVYVIE